VLAVTLLRSDHTIYGVFYIFIFYYFRDRPRGRTVALTAGVLLLAVDRLMLTGNWQFSLVLTATAAAAIPITFYNNERGRDGRVIRAVFYMFYPLHLLLLYVLAQIFPPPG
jgi:hypothetical protein